MEEHNLFPIEQKRCRKGSYGCKDQLLINKMILKNIKTKHSNLSTVWIDYKKAFDSMSHTWIINCLEIFKLSPIFINFIKTTIKLRNTNLFLPHSNGIFSFFGLKIKCGIFQGDSLSPVLFSMALIPLSKLLNETRYGYKIRGKNINHLFYIDDLKIYASSDGELEGMLKTVKKFSDDIGMEFGLNKCAKASFKKGKLSYTSGIKLSDGTIIRELEQEEVYKYLGVNEGSEIKHAMMKEKLRKECIRRVRIIMKTELNTKNRIIAINTIAVPVISYSFNIITWNLNEIKRIDTKISKQLTCHRMHHPKSNIDRLYLQGNNGGRRLIHLETFYKSSTIGLFHYLSNTEDRMLKLVHLYESSKKLHSIVKEANKFSRKLYLNLVDYNNALKPIEFSKRLKKIAKHESMKRLEISWQEKPLHGKFATRCKNDDVDTKATHQWLTSSGLKAETEGFIFAAQDQSLVTKNFQANIIRNGTDSKFRFYGEKVETIDHLISGCSVLTP